MNLRYISITCDCNCSFTNEFVNIFAYNTRFICNWMSKNVRKLKIPTDGTFNHINVVVSTNENSCRISSQNTLRVTIHWTEKNIEEYLTLRDEGKRIQLYLNLLRKGLIRAADFYDIHLNELLSLIDVFQQNGCKNEWLLKSTYNKDWNLRIMFTCHFSTSDFKLKLTLSDSKKNKIAEKIVFRIYPDEIFFANRIKQYFVKKLIIG